MNYPRSAKTPERDIKPPTAPSIQSKSVDPPLLNQSTGSIKAKRPSLSVRTNGLPITICPGPPVQPSPQDEDRSNKLPETCPTPTMAPPPSWNDGSLYYNNPFANQPNVPDSQVLKAMGSYLNLSPSQRYLPSELKMLNQQGN